MQGLFAGLNVKNVEFGTISSVSSLGKLLKTGVVVIVSVDYQIAKTVTGILLYSKSNVALPLVTGPCCTVAPVTPDV